jgi:hypothetical protein
MIKQEVAGGIWPMLEQRRRPIVHGGVTADGAELALMVHVSKLSCRVRVLCMLF